MKIEKINEGGLEEIRNLETSLASHFASSRFTFNIDSKIGRKYITITLSKIRLKTSKSYCGNHPGPCVLGGKKRKRIFLEGLDWVEFNDTLNNWADTLNLEADISSSVCVIRIGKDRRISYDGHNLNTPQAEWNKYGDYKNYCGKVAPISSYPHSTPGEYYESN